MHDLMGKVLGKVEKCQVDNPFCVSEYMSSTSTSQLKQNDLRIRHDYEALVPRPSAEESQALELSMKKFGQIDAIIVNGKGEVLDGHSRFHILKKLGSDVKFTIRLFRTEEEEKDFLRKQAIARRGLTDFQKALLAQDRLKEEKNKALTRLKSGRRETLASIDARVGKATTIIAKEFGIAGPTFERACFIINHATSEQISNLEKRKTSVNGLYASLKKQRPGHDDNRSHNESAAQKNSESHDSTKEAWDEKSGGKSTTGSSEDTGDGNAIDRDTVCDDCHRHFTRGEIKAIARRLCIDCRRKAGLKY